MAEATHDRSRGALDENAGGGTRDDPERPADRADGAAAERTGKLGASLDELACIVFFALPGE